MTVRTEAYFNALSGAGAVTETVFDDLCDSVVFIVEASTGAALIPSGTTAQRPGTPAAGHIRFNSETGELEWYDGSAWQSSTVNWEESGSVFRPTADNTNDIGDTTHAVRTIYVGTSIEVGHDSDSTLTRSAAGKLAVEGNVIYNAGGTDVALADGGTGASLADPGADRIMFWDDSAGAVTWLTAGSGLTITDTTITAASGAAGTDTQVQFNDGGTNLGGDAGLVYNKTSNALTCSDSIYSQGGAGATRVSIGNTAGVGLGVSLGSGGGVNWDASDANPVNGNGSIAIRADAAGVLAQRFGTTAQTFRVYGTFTDTSNYERMALKTNAGASVEILAETAGTGADNLDVILTPSGSGNVKFGSHTAIGGESVSGYITIKDSGGTLRKLAVVS